MANAIVTVKLFVPYDGEFTIPAQQLWDMDKEIYFRHFKISVSRLDDGVHSLQYVHIFSHQCMHSISVAISESLVIILQVWT